MLAGFVTSYEPRRAAFDVTYPTLIADSRSDILVAELDSAIVGYVMASDTPTLFANGTVTELLELYVIEAHRRHGFGRALVAQAVDRARKCGAVEVTVPTRRARTFYEAQGFEITAEFFKLRFAK
jgi:GNAT superfamily N-acetyltransferase